MRYVISALDEVDTEGIVAKDQPSSNLVISIGF